METIEHQGVTFVKATALAKKYRYTTDYIGQLCRKGKVDSKLVGRAWFVNEQSLIGHKSERYSSARSSEILIKNSILSDHIPASQVVKTAISPRLSKLTHRQFLADNKDYSKNFVNHFSERISSYGDDNTELEPVLKPRIVTSPENFVSNVDIPEHKINVVLEERPINKLTFESLPEVVLNGDLAVASLDDEALYHDVEPVLSEDLNFDQVSENRLKVSVTRRYQPEERFIAHTKTFSQPKIKNVTDISLPIKPEQVPVAKLNFSPALVNYEKTTNRVSFLFIPGFLLVSGLLVFLLFSLTTFIESGSGQFKTSLKFNLASVSDVLIKITESYKQ